MTTRSHSALERCVGPAGAFLNDAWGRTPFYRRTVGGFADLLTLADVDHMISTMSLRLPAFRLVKDGKTLPPSGYTKSGRIGSTAITGIAHPAHIFQRFQEGATIVLQGMHRYWLPLARFCRDLELTLSHPAQVNGYVTPPGSRGLAVHEDSHDVFVLQVHGRKLWEVWDPSADGSTLSRAREGGASSLAIELEPGDCLYMPKSTPHAARTEDRTSAHLTIGVLTRTWGSLLGDLVKRLEREPSFREALPAGFHRQPEKFTAEIEERLTDLQRWLDKANPADLAEGAIRRFLTTRPSVLPGGLLDLVETDSLGDGSTVRRRAGSVCEVRRDGEMLLVYLGDRELRMPGWLEPAMVDIAPRDEFMVAEVAGDLDPDSRLVLIKRLVREGLLELPPQPSSVDAGEESSA